MAEPFAFMPEALESNAAGRLTDAQVAMFEERVGFARWFPTLTGDLHRREVRVIEGPIRKTKGFNVAPTAATSTVPRHYLEVDGRNFAVPSQSVWDAAPAAGHVRLYYLPRSHTAVNLERLPDPPVESTSPEAVIGSVADALGSALRPSFTRRGSARKAELAAQADAVLRAATGADSPAVPQVAPGPASAAAASQDLIGRWTSPFFTVDVRADGTLDLEPALAGPSQRGQWSIEPDGKLHVRFDGGSGADDLVSAIAVAGNRLTIDLDGQQITLQRIT